MSEPDSKVTTIITEFERMHTARITYENAWRDIRQLVRPQTVDFSSYTSPGDVRGERMYDGTAMQSNSDLAGELHAQLFSPSERSFGLDADAPVDIRRDPEVIEWCDHVADVIFTQYADERSMFTSSGHEILLDIGAFGNGILNQEWNQDTGTLLFRAYPLASCCFDESSKGLVDRLYRCVKMSLRQIRQDFPDVTWPDIDKEKPSREMEVIHAVYPRTDRIAGKYDAINRPFASCWVLKDKKLLLKEDGYYSFPYHVARWSKIADEIYGRGPAINCLANIRMLNRMKLTTIKAANKAVSPAIAVPNDGFLSPFKVIPDAINYFDADALRGSGMSQPFFQMEHRGNFPVSFEMMEAERKFIRQTFYTDWTEWIPKTERQTATEIMDLEERKQNKMAPLYGRLQTELMVPLVSRSFELCDRAGLIPDPPEVIRGRRLKVVYVSAAARAQAASETRSMNTYIQQLVPLVQVHPEVLDAINFENLVQELAIKQRIPRSILRSEEEMTAMKQEREQKQQALAMAGAAEPVSKSILNLAKAREAGGIAA